MKKIIAGDGSEIGRGSRVFDWGSGETGTVTEAYEDGIVRVALDNYPGMTPAAVAAEDLGISSE